MTKGETVTMWRPVSPSRALSGSTVEQIPRRLLRGFQGLGVALELGCYRPTNLSEPSDSRQGRSWGILTVIDNQAPGPDYSTDR
jgi:hypothetical protein